MILEEINKSLAGTFMDLLNIRFTGWTGDRVEADMPIVPSLYQPTGVVHGGALISLAETVGGAGSFLSVNPENFDIYGSVINSQHLSPAREGTLHAVAILVYKGDFKHIWDVEIKDDEGKLISVSRVTNSVRPKEKP